jgi:hypothetical protein
VHIASAALQRFSKRFFKELHLLDACLELLADSVPNVRLAAARLLPYLKLTIRLPEDVDYLVGGVIVDVCVGGEGGGAGCGGGWWCRVCVPSGCVCWGGLR